MNPRFVPAQPRSVARPRNLVSPTAARRRATRAAAAAAAARPADVGGVSRCANLCEGLESRTYFAVSVNGQGWTVVTPSADTKTIYVSTSGNDNNAGTSPSAPVATITRARALTRTNAPDQILLRRGDTFFTPITNWDKSGRSEQEPFVIGAYTDPVNPSAQRPKIASGIATAFNNHTGVATSHVYVMGVAFEAHTRNFRQPPANNAFTTAWRSEGNGGSNGMRVLGPVDDFLVEDCSFRYYKVNLTLQTTVGSNGQDRVVSDVRLRRNIIADAYAPNVDQYGIVYQEPAIGVYAEGVRGLTMDGNLLSHNGWAADNALGALANQWSHNAYINSGVQDFVYVNNISVDAAATGIQARAGGVLKDNLFLRNPIAMTYGYLNGGGKFTQGGVSGEVSGNVVVGTARIVDSPRGYGIELGNLRPASNGGGTVVRNNVFSNDSADNNQYAIYFNVGVVTNPDSPPDVGINDLLVEDNVVYSWARGLYVHPYYNATSGETRTLRGVTVRDNDFQRLFSGNGPMVDHTARWAPGTETWTNNRYDGTSSDSGASRWFRVQGSAMTFSQWKATYEPTAVKFTATGFPDPGRTAGTYMRSLGYLQQTDLFIDEAFKQSRSYWRKAYTTAAVNPYVRAGYSGGRIDTGAPTASADADNVAVAGEATHSFTVTYADDDHVKFATLGDGDVRVTGPGGFSAAAQLVSVFSSSPEGDRRTVRYQFNAPGGQWTSAANGVYQLSVVANQVFDGADKPAAAGVIGSFAVTIDPAVPSAVATAPTVVNDTADATVTVTYTGAITPSLPTIVTPLNPGFETPNVGANAPSAFAVGPLDGNWSFAGGAGVSGFNSSITAASPAAPQGAQVAFLPDTASFSQAVTGWQAGTYTISFRAAQQAAALSTQDVQVFVDDQPVGTFAPAGTTYQQFTTAPFHVAAGTHTVRFAGLNTAASTTNMAFVDDVQIAGTTDPVQQQINGFTLGPADLRLVGPAGGTFAASAAAPAPDASHGPQKQVTYTFPAPAGGWSGLGFSSLNATVVAAQVSTTSGANVPAAKVATLHLDVRPPAAEVRAADVTAASTAAHAFTVTFTDDAAGVAASLDSADLRVTGPGGYWGSGVTFVGATGDGTAASPLVATYTVVPPSAAGWTALANGVYSVHAVAGQVVDADGNPLPAGEIGQFRVAIDASPPLADLNPVQNQTATGTTGKALTVYYYDVNGINAATLDNNDIRVTGPNSFAALATRGTILQRTNGYTVTYTVPAPAGGWKSRYNGTMTVALQPNQVADVAGNSTPTAQTLGTFTVALETTPPTASLTAVTPDPRNAPVNNLYVRFSEAVTAFDAADLSLTRNGVAVPIADATVTTADGGVNFTVGNVAAATAPAGNYAFTVKAGGIEDAAGNALAVAETESWTTDLTPPTVSAAAATNVATASGASTITVTYADAIGVNASSLDSADLQVTGPNGYSALATFVSSSGSATSRTATYSLPAPAGGWQTAAHNGAYAVALRASQVTDTAGNAAAAAAGVATFAVSVPPAVTGVAVNGGGALAQRSMVNSLTVSFSAPVVLAAGAFSLAGRNGAGAAGTSLVVTPAPGGGTPAQTYTITFAGPAVSAGSLADGVYDFTVLASAVRAGSSTGAAMSANYATKFHRLYSDADGDGDSDSADLAQFRQSLNRVEGDPLYNWYFDFNGSGTVDATDLAQVRSRRDVLYVGY